LQIDENQLTGSNMLHITATHHSTLQHTAICCDTLQHTMCLRICK